MPQHALCRITPQAHYFRSSTGSVSPHCSLAGLPGLQACVGCPSVGVRPPACTRRMWAAAPRSASGASSP
eukprot:scaffold15987_cov67-Phaeocystis_antarctica.AAC.3